MKGSMTMEKPENEMEVEQEIVGSRMSFHYLVSIIQNGDLNAELTNALSEMGDALAGHYHKFGGVPKGEISLKIKFALEKGYVKLTADRTVKIPKPPEHGELLFIDRSGNFSRDNPNQLHMGFPRTGPRAVS